MINCDYFDLIKQKKTTMKKSGRVKNSQNLDNRQNRFIDSSLRPSDCLVSLGNASNQFACNDLLAALEELYSQSQVAQSFILLGCAFPVNFDDDGDNDDDGGGGVDGGL